MYISGHITTMSLTFVVDCFPGVDTCMWSGSSEVVFFQFECCRFDCWSASGKKRSSRWVGGGQ